MKTVIVEEVYNAPVSTIWNALTQKEKMKDWYFNLSEFKPEVGFEFSFAGEGHKGEQYMHLCKITEVIPNQKLQYSWQYQNIPGYSLVTFELFEEGNQTRLKLTHSGLETFPTDNPDFASESFNMGWTEIITRQLPHYLSDKKHTDLVEAGNA